jgi:hypothetical protein
LRVCRYESAWQAKSPTIVEAPERGSWDMAVVVMFPVVQKKVGCTVS